MEVADKTHLFSDKRSVEQQPDLVPIILEYNFQYRKIVGLWRDIGTYC